jgi:aminopeptidase N
MVFKQGHPVLDINYQYDAAAKHETVKISQLQKTGDGIPVFTLPLKVDVYSGGKVTRHNILVNQKEQEFSFASATPPDLVNVDADKSLVCEKSDNKTDTAFAFQMTHAPLFMDRLEALQYFEKDEESPYYGQVIQAGMNDRFWVIRAAALDNLQMNAMEMQIKKYASRYW